MIYWIFIDKTKHSSTQAPRFELSDANQLIRRIRLATMYYRDWRLDSCDSLVKSTKRKKVAAIDYFKRKKWDRHLASAATCH
uniref:AlNc14C52G4042 protein n=1 Tax=Albugo laibachii Nc14 TaxID=890382 RepID=F0WBJ7_9STRA|nr:AlNc14C52G4042 [Albugo laibachii Nc14]|eukprot:CCA18524.1 AlNc14C52G4042 [Albugo laibachii Nc14]